MMNKALTSIFLIAFSGLVSATEDAKCEAESYQSGLMWTPPCDNCSTVGDFKNHAETHFTFGPEGPFDGYVGVVINYTTSGGVKKFATITIQTFEDGRAQANTNSFARSKDNQSCDNPDEVQVHNTGGSSGGGSGSFFLMAGVLHNYNMPGAVNGTITVIPE